MTRGKFLAVAWGVTLVAAIAAVWLPLLSFLISTTFISWCSIYANMASHLAEHEGERNLTADKFEARMDRLESLLREGSNGTA